MVYSYGNTNQPHYTPTAPPEPGPYQQPPHAASFGSAQIPPQPSPYQPPPGYAPSTPPHNIPTSSSSSLGSGHARPPQGYGYGLYPYSYDQAPQQQQQVNYTANLFPPGTHPDVIRSYQMVDRNRNGYIEETELQEALSAGYQRFSRRTLRLLIFLFKNNHESSNRIGPKEFAEIWSCLGQWRAIFERFDRDRSGKIDAVELRDALYSLGYALPPSVLQVLISRYDDGTGRRVDLDFDSFIECGMIVKGLTEKFKEKDARYTGSATLTYDTFMSMIIPFLVAD